MEKKFTRGEWHAIEYAGYFELHQQPYYGEVNLLNREECIEAPSNAQLAAAAPDLLEALQAFVTAGAGPNEAMQQAKRAIAKALGNELE